MKWFVLSCCAMWVSLPTARATEVYSNPQWTGSAIDAKGVKHEARSYPGSRPPWARDQISAVGPEYPSADQHQRHEGRGLFQLAIDLKSGAVVKITVIKSTGFVSLDRCATAALRQWRWPPGKWKEITMPITFKLGATRDTVPKDARILPPVRY